MAPAILDRNGHVVQDANLELGRHFAKDERGELCVNTAELETARCTTSTNINGEEMVTFASLSKAFGSLKTKRAPGPSGIPPEAFAGAAREAAVQYHPLAVKMAVRAQCPTAWRGGQTAVIPKPNKPPQDLAGWRAILLQESAAKGIASSTRDSLIQGYRQRMQPGQGGSVPDFPLHVPILQVKSFLRDLRDRHASGGFAFLDGKAAFYATIRQFFTGNEKECPAQQIQSLAETLFEDQHDQVQFLATAMGPGLLAAAQVPLPVRRMVLATMDRTWFSIGPNGQHIFQTKTGTMPGAPLADLLFQYTFSIFMEKLQSQLQQHGLDVQLPPAYNCTSVAPTPSWMDDVAIPVKADRADDLVDNATKTLSLASKCLKEIGIRLNWARGKTELVLAFRGEGSKKAKTKWLCEHDSKCWVEVAGENPQEVHITDKYLHLGAMASWEGSDVHDLKYRRGLARQAFQAYKRLLHNEHLTAKEKLELLDALVLSRMMYAAGTWEMHQHQMAQLYQASVMEFYRRVFRPITGFSSRSLTDSQICNCLGVLSPEELRTHDIVQRLAWVKQQGGSFLNSLVGQGKWGKEAHDAEKFPPAND
ncbi:unnamed protein product [Symbiodinium natans]|uniref:Reverse transcriptase domain-containing protein n=1 Tax=Symbiodinium natans TaxID=878477 RepID=A0A812TLB4_9DINO|nr:unnamed protein product [Symbiodinium natans]